MHMCLKQVPDMYRKCIMHQMIYTNGTPSRNDKYEAGVRKYWVEDDMEGEWNKVKSTSQVEHSTYEIEGVLEDLVGDLTAGPSSFDPAQFSGLEGFFGYLHVKYSLVRMFYEAQT